MPRTTNPLMVKAGWMPATRVAAALFKSLPTIHNMVNDGIVEGCVEGGVLYVKISSLREHYAKQNNAPLLAAITRLERESQPPPAPRKSARG